MKKLNLGAGTDLKEDYDNADIQQSDIYDKVFDFNTFPYPIEDDTYEEVYCRNVLEHLKEPDKVIKELIRITKDMGTIFISVPHYTNKGAYSSMQHIHFFNEDCFILLEKDLIYKDKSFKIKKIRLIPTNIGRFIPGYIRKKSSLFINGLYSQIEVEMIVTKTKESRDYQENRFNNHIDHEKYSKQYFENER